MLVIPWGRNDDGISNDDIGALQLMEFFVLCGVATRGANSGCRFCHRTSLRASRTARCMDRYKLHAGSKGVGLSWKEV